MGWADLESHWTTCFELAWRAFGRGTTPVGAVLAGPTGGEVATGVNRRYAAPGTGTLAGSHLAHAEVAALGVLDAHGTYPDHVLYTTLEPCLLCVGAAIMATVGEVRWAGVDPYAGATTILGGSNAHIDRGMTRFSGPLPGAAGAFAAGLHVAFCLHRDPDGLVVAAYRKASPEIVAVADAMLADGVVEAARRGTAVGDVYDRIAASLG